jgi:hypothetical protein
MGTKTIFQLEMKSSQGAKPSKRSDDPLLFGALSLGTKRGG